MPLLFLVLALAFFFERFRRMPPFPSSFFSGSASPLASFEWCYVQSQIYGRRIGDTNHRANEWVTNQANGHLIKRGLSECSALATDRLFPFG